MVSLPEQACHSACYTPEHILAGMESKIRVSWVKLVVCALFLIKKKKNKYLTSVNTSISTGVSLGKVSQLQDEVSGPKKSGKKSSRNSWKPKTSPGLWETQFPAPVFACLTRQRAGSCWARCWNVLPLPKPHEKHFLSHGTSMENPPGSITHHTIRHELEDSHPSLGFAIPHQWNDQLLSPLKGSAQCLQKVPNLWEAARNSISIWLFSIALESKAYTILALIPLAPRLWSQLQKLPLSLLVLLLHRASNPSQTSHGEVKSRPALIYITDYIIFAVRRMMGIKFYNMALSPWNDSDFPGDAGGNATYQLSCPEVSQAQWEQALRPSHQSMLASGQVAPEGNHVWWFFTFW